ncbi:MAG: hypothetical protein ACKVJH_03660 [Flavobacteriales bacterium]
MRSFELILLALVIGTGSLTNCTNPGQAAASSEPFAVHEWAGTWEGARPEYPMRDGDGNVIVIQGQNARVLESVFQFDVSVDGSVRLMQSSNDGRVMEFSGSWKGQGTSPALKGILCDMTASSGAYRQYALMADSSKRMVMCYGTSREPLFEVIWSP